jgi:hypothetical protein
MNKSKDYYDKLQSISTVVATLLLPLVLLLIGNRFVSAEKASDLKLKYIEIALLQLQKEPSSEMEPLRVWAIEVLAENSPVPITKEMRQQLLNKPLHTDGGNYVSSGNAPKVSSPPLLK